MTVVFAIDVFQSAASASGATNNVAADFAARVAATLSTSSESTAKTSATTETVIVGDSSLHDASATENVSSTVPSTQAGDSHHQQVPCAASISSINDSQPVSDVAVSTNVLSTAAEAAADSAPPTIPPATAGMLVAESERPSEVTVADAYSSKVADTASLIADPASKPDAVPLEPGIVFPAESAAAPVDVNQKIDGPVVPSDGNTETASLPLSSAEASPTVFEGTEACTDAGRSSEELKKEDQSGGTSCLLFFVTALNCWKSH
jgi:hypothetical protein